MKKKIIIIVIPIIILLFGIIIFVLLTNDKVTSKEKKNIEYQEKIDNETESLRIIPSKDELTTENNKTNDSKQKIDENKSNNNTNNSTNNKSSNQSKNNDLNNVIDEKKSNDNITVKPTTNQSKQEYKCPSGYNLDGSMCYKEIKPKIEYVCGINQTEAGGYCLINTSTYANVNYSCPDGYSLNGDTCYKEQITGSFNSKNYSNMAETLQRDMYSTFQNSCRGIIRDENGISYCYETVQTYANATYSCPSGTGELAGDKCISIKTEKAFEKYHCDEGSLDPTSKMCVIRIKAEKK